MTRLHPLLFAASILATAHLSDQVPREPMVDSLRHAPGKLVKIMGQARPTALGAEAECKKVKLPAVGSDSTGSYFPVTVLGFTPPKSAQFPKDFPSQFWINVDAKGKVLKIEYLKAPSKEFAKALDAAAHAASFKPAIYKNCAVEAWLIGRVQKATK